MENHTAPTLKSTVLYGIAYTVALTLVVVGMLNLAVPVGPSDSPAPGAVQSAPAATKEAQAPSAPPGEGTQNLGAAEYTLTGVFLFADQIGGKTNFSPADVVSGDCRLTDGGKKTQSMTLFQDLGTQTGLSGDLLRAYTSGSVIKLSNAQFVAGESPYIVADAMIVPKASADPFPPYLEVKQAKFRWALPMMLNPAGQNVGDPLIVCNYV